MRQDLRELEVKQGGVRAAVGSHAGRSKVSSSEAAVEGWPGSHLVDVGELALVGKRARHCGRGAKKSVTTTVRPYSHVLGLQPLCSVLFSL